MVIKYFKILKKEFIFQQVAYEQTQSQVKLYSINKWLTQSYKFTDRNYSLRSFLFMDYSMYNTHKMMKLENWIEKIIH